MFTLSTCGDLGAAPDQVIAVGDGLIFRITHVIERTNAGGVVGQEDELVAILLCHVGSNLALTLRVHVVIVARNFISTLSDNLLGFSQRDARERNGGNNDVHVEEFLDFFTVLFLHRADGGNEKLFLHLHDVFVAVDPADLSVNRDELSCVARSEGRVCAEDGADLEDLAEASGLCHLLEELRRLRKVGLAFEVFDFEELSVGLAGAGHELGGVQLDVVALNPVRTHGVLKSGLCAEDEVIASFTQVKEAPVETLVNAAVCGNGCLRVRCGDNFDVRDLDLETAELHALVELELTGHTNE